MAKAITPDYLARTGTEHGEQTAVFCWANMAYWHGFEMANNMGSYAIPQKLPEVPAVPELRWMFAIPNGGGRTPAQASQLKAEGVKPGVSDIMLPVARYLPKEAEWIDGEKVVEYNGLFIEMKRAAGVPSDVKKEQRDFILFVSDQGYYASVAFGWHEATKIIEWYLIGAPK